MEPDDEAVAFAHRMFDLARGGSTSELAAYIDAGVPVDLTDDKGDTFLILAAYYGHPDLVAALIARAADPDRTNDRGQTALSAATFAQSAASVTALIDAGGDPGLGSPSAVETARFFELPAMGALLEGRGPGR